MFDLSLLDAGFGLAALIALIAGVLSFLSPCVLPVVPPYLAYMGGISMGDLTGAAGKRRSVVVPALFFVLGLSTVFLFMGFAASAMGRIFLQYQGVMTKLSGAMVIVLGLHFLHILRIPLLDREARLDAGDRGGSSLGAYVLGLAFAFGWTPCIGPQLGAILSLAASEASLARGTVLLAIYAVGLGIPFLLAAIFVTRSIALMGRMRRHMALIEKAMGLLLILVGAALMLGAFSRLSYWLLETFPALANLG
ncbi:MAG: cytochrome c biogenesis protein CcdA [Rhodobacteraceae bacterium]|nr:cytochrome c biogenesis protein CcdA [Paracoccaceae bacterium]